MSPLLLLLGLLAIAAPSGDAAPSAAKRVFILNSYRAGYEWTDYQVRGIHSKLEEGAVAVETQVDFLDRLRAPAADDDFRARYHARYSQQHFDLVITTDDDALEFIVKNPSLFLNTPVVFGGVSNSAFLNSLPRRRFTGVVEVFADLAMVDTALAIHPNTRRLLLVSDGTATSSYFVNSLSRRAATAPWTLETIDGNRLTFPAILQQLQRATPGDLVFVATLNRDSTGAYLAATGHYPQLASASPVPVYGLASPVGQGFLAGTANTGVNHGRRIGTLALQALAGTPPQDIPFFHDDENQLQFDARQMVRFGIEHAQLPKGTQILFQKDTFFERYAPWIFLAAAFFTLQTLIIGGLAFNVFQRRKAERALSASHAQLEAQNQQLAAAAETKKRFLANMSHELRTPMNAIIGMSDLLLDSPLGFRQREFAETVRNSANSLLGIINDVLELSRMEAGHVRIQLAPFAVAPVFDDLVRSLQTAAAPDVAIHASLPPDFPPFLLSDSHRVRQVLLNFLFNAVKFTTHGRIELSASSDRPGQYRFAVSDTGIGIPSDQLEHVFDRFYQVDDSSARPFGGSGLGLSICREIVHALHGEIGVESTFQQGSTFWFRIPAAAQQEAPPAPVPVPAPPSGIRVLVVEDNPVNLRLARLLLEKVGCVVNTSSGGVEALSRFQNESFDVIFMDIQMPDMDGLEVTRRIRSIEANTRHTPVIALTAGVSAQDRSLCLEAGMDDYLAKPVSRDELAQMLSRYAP